MNNQEMKERLRTFIIYTERKIRVINTKFYTGSSIELAKSLDGDNFHKVIEI